MALTAPSCAPTSRTSTTSIESSWTRTPNREWSHSPGARAVEARGALSHGTTSLRPGLRVGPLVELRISIFYNNIHFSISSRRVLSDIPARTARIRRADSRFRKRGSHSRSCLITQKTTQDSTRMHIDSCMLMPPRRRSRITTTRQTEKRSDTLGQDACSSPPLLLVAP